MAVPRNATPAQIIPLLRDHPRFQALLEDYGAQDRDT